jgi:antibiotic biosynthesis monooxygenase (ABM) superfamily enzyme
MAKGKNKDHVSFWFWMFALFVMALPCIGFVMIIVWAFVGENETRKNYFRALIAWFLIFTALWVGIMALGFWPEIQKTIQGWLHQLK